MIYLPTLQGQALLRASGPLDADLVRRDARAILGYQLRVE
jgi:hypothetical protein